MKSAVYRAFSVFILCFLFLSCESHLSILLLKQSESLLQEHPDSSLALLEHLSANRFHLRKYRASYALLYALSLDKNYIDITEDSLARYALNYYSDIKDSRHEMLSWYTLGLAQRNARNIGGSVVSFSRAEELSRIVGDMHYQGLAARCLGDLYLEALDGITAKNWYETSEAAFLRSGENRYANYSKYAQVSCLQNVLKFKEAGAILDSLMRGCRDTDPYLYSQILFSKAANELLSKDGRALDAIRMLEERHSMINEPQGCLEACYLSMAYNKIGQADSSAFYKEKACRLMQSPADSARIYYLLYLSDDRREDYLSANRHLLQSMEIQNRLMNLRQSMSVANSLSDFHKEQSRLVIKAAEKQRQFWLLVFALGLSVVIILSQRIVVHRKSIRERDRIIQEKQERIQEDLARIGEITEELSSYKMAASSEMSALIEKNLKGQLNLINKWSQAYYLLNSPDMIDKKDPYRHLDADYQSKKEIALNNFEEALTFLRKDQPLFDSIEWNVNLLKNDIMKKLRSTFSEKGKRCRFTENDYRILTLLYARFPEKVIAYLVGMNYGALRMRKSHFKAIFIELGEPVAGEFLHELG